MIGAAPTVQVAADEHVFLVGRPPLSEYLAFIETHTVEGAGADRQALAAEWRSANDRIIELEQNEAGSADGVAVNAVPPELRASADQVLADPLVQRAFAVLPVEIGVVELDRLVVHQKQINVGYVAALRTALGDTPSSAELFAFALPRDRRYDVPIRAGRTGPNAWTFVSDSTDFRPLEPVLIDPAHVAGGMPLTGVPTAVVALSVGYGSNFLTAIQVDGRLVLNNGSHRAYALREAGHTHAPCLIQTVSRREELEMVGVEPLNQRPQVYLDDPRPPLLKDYFDPQLRRLVHVPRKARQVRVMFNYEVTDAPLA